MSLKRSYQARNSIREVKIFLDKKRQAGVSESGWKKREEHNQQNNKEPVKRYATNHRDYSPLSSLSAGTSFSFLL